MTGVTGAATENGSWIGAAYHLGIWKQDRIRYIGALTYASLNLNYFALGNAFNDLSFSYNIEGAFTLQEISFGIADSNFFEGLHYEYFATESRFDLGIDIPGVPPLQLDSKTADLGLTVEYDSRDTIFTPNRGIHAEVLAMRYDDLLGGDFDYERFKVYLHASIPYIPNWYLGSDWTDGSPTATSRFMRYPILKCEGLPPCATRTRTSWWRRGRSVGTFTTAGAWWDFWGLVGRRHP